MNTLTQIRFVWKPVVFVACAMPAILVVTDGLQLTGSLGANPIEEIMDRFGNWGLRFIMVTLAITPLRRITGRSWLLRFRRMFGLFTFFYIFLHFLTWFWLDQGMLWHAVVEDVLERPFITIGFAAFVLLFAMAITSTTNIRRRMGRNWDRLHYGAYAVGVLAVWHYWWQVKKDIAEPLIYAIVLTVLLGARAWHRLEIARTAAKSSS